jgi:[ribosomal protein S5]-alanine N-acetyltransferase
MPDQPTLDTSRLRLRPFALTDTPAVQTLAGEYDIAATTLLIPHPYPDGAAEAWIAAHAEKFLRGEEVNFAITDRESGQLMGAIGLRLTLAHRRGELGYWIGKPFWNRGYCTEGGQAMLDYARLCFRTIWAASRAGVSLRSQSRFRTSDDEARIAL